MTENKLNEKLSWETLVELEPRLDSLLVDAKFSRPRQNQKRGFNYECAWAEFKDPIAELVGFFRRDECDPILKTRAAYELVYWTLYDTLHA